MRNPSIVYRRVILLLVVAVSGCTIHPPGEQAERSLAARSGKAYATTIERRPTLVLPANPTPEQLVQFAFLTNAELEQRYWEWRSAIEQIPQEGTQTTALNVALGTSLTNGRTSLRNSTLTFGNDPMTDIKWPGKLDTAARQALENARASGQRFIKAKFDLRAKVLDAYYDYSLTSEMIRLAGMNRQLLQTASAVTAAKSRAGTGSQHDALKAANEADLSANDIAQLKSELVSQRAALDAMLGRQADAPFNEPQELPQTRAIAQTDAEVIQLAATRNPELAALVDEIRARSQGVSLAELQRVPDFNLSIGTDLMGVTQSLLGQATIPLFRHEAIEAAVAQAEANLRASQAMRREAANDLASQVLSDLAFIHDADRQLGLFGGIILPRTRGIADIARSAYETGHSSLLDLLDDERSLIAIERLVASIKVAREKRLLHLEAIATVDLEHVSRPCSVQPSH